MIFRRETVSDARIIEGLITSPTDKLYGQALIELQRQTEGAIKGMIKNMGGDWRDYYIDVLTESIIRIIKQAKKGTLQEKLRENVKVSTWFIAIAKYVYLEMQRQRGKEIHPMKIQEESDYIDDSQSETEFQEKKLLNFKMEFSKLKSACKLLLSLWEGGEGKSDKEIFDLLHPKYSSEHSVKTARHKCINKLFTKRHIIYND